MFAKTFASSDNTAVTPIGQSTTQSIAPGITYFGGEREITRDVGNVPSTPNIVPREIGVLNSKRFKGEPE